MHFTFVFCIISVLSILSHVIFCKLTSGLYSIGSGNRGSGKKTEDFFSEVL